MIVCEDGCVGCPPELGCLGSACPHKKEYYLECDDCGDDVDELFYSNIDNRQLCKNCLIEEHRIVEIED